MRVATYLRVSTGLQTVENQRLEIERHVAAKGWVMFKEYADEGASGATTRRPALDQLMADARRRRFDVVCVAKLDRFGRSLKDLVLTLEELQSLGSRSSASTRGSTSAPVSAASSSTFWPP